MRAKPEMNPWVSTDKSEMSSFRSGTNSASIGGLAWGSAAPLGLKECVSMPNPGLAPWAMQEYRPYGARMLKSSYSKYWCASSRLLQGSMDSSFVSL